MVVYAITNLVTGKVYIGQHKGGNLRQYLQKKFYYARHQKTGSSYLFNAMRKYTDPEQWSIEPLMECETKEQLDRMETILIALYDTRNPEVGYNICRGGEGFTGKHSQYVKDRVRETHLGKSVSEETRSKIRAARLGKPLTSEHREKLRLSHLGKQPSRAAVEAAKAANTGGHPTEVALQRMRSAKLGRKRDPQTLRWL